MRVQINYTLPNVTDRYRATRDDGMLASAAIASVEAELLKLHPDAVITGKGVEL